MAKVVKYSLLFIGVVILIPLDLVVAFGMSFTASSNFKVSHAFFLLFACLLDVPSVAVSFIKPRLGSFMILLSAALSLAMAAVFFVGRGELPTGKVGGQALLFWGIKVFVGAGLFCTHVVANKPSPIALGHETRMS